MKVIDMLTFAIEYDFLQNVYRKDISADDKYEHRIEIFTDLAEFVECVKRVQSHWWNSNIKVYQGRLAEFDIAKISNPFA